MVLGLSGGIQAKASGIVFDMARQPGLVEPHPTLPKDYSRYHHTITFKGAGEPDWVWNGKVWVMSFDGSNDRAVVADHPSLSPPYISVEAWVYKKGDVNYCGVIQKGGGYVVDSGYKLQWRTGDTLRFIIWDATTFRYVEVAVDQDGWHHLIGTYDGTNVILYKNTVPTSLAVPAGTIASNTLPLWIGNDEDIPTRCLNGYIGFVRLRDYPLTQPQVTARFNATSYRFMGLM